MTATLRRDFDEFLFAQAGHDSDGTPVTLLTVLARLGVDPWEEAADLAHLSREPAMQRLASRLEAMPNRSASAADTVNIAARLIALLHRAPVRKGPVTESPAPELPKSSRTAKPSKGFNLATYLLIGLTFFLVAQWALSSRPALPPMDTSIAQSEE